MCIISRTSLVAEGLVSPYPNAVVIRQQPRRWRIDFSDRDSSFYLQLGTKNISSSGEVRLVEVATRVFHADLDSDQLQHQLAELIVNKTTVSRDLFDELVEVRRFDNLAEIEHITQENERRKKAHEAALGWAGVHAWGDGSYTTNRTDTYSSLITQGSNSWDDMKLLPPMCRKKCTL